MSKMTRHDLQTKTAAQLAALFNETSRSLGSLSQPSRARENALGAMSMIRAELARRGPSP